MQFHIDRQANGVLSGWIVPTNPGGTPHVKVIVNDEEIAVVGPNVNRQDIKDLGLHTTGFVGFHIDDKVVKGIQKAENVQLVEQETGLMVHRHTASPYRIEKRVMFFNLCVVPQIRMRNMANDLFSLTYTNSERITFATISSILINHNAHSLFVMGRSNHNRIAEFLLSRDYMRFALLRDPVVELAERLVMIKQISRSTNRKLLENLVAGLENLFGLCETIDLENEDSLHDAFTRLRPQQIQAIADPFLRALVCDQGDEPEERHISIALDRLAEFDAVGVEERIDEFNTCVEEAIGRNLFAGYEPYVLPGTMELAERLQQIDKVQEYLEFDVVLYRELRDVIDTEFGSPRTAPAPASGVPQAAQRR
ncbi:MULTISPECIES: hypothetical protein [unclassified Stappia]|uniref:hypothetical protein n=1 Tax=unclassified Stappia TaxID=2629676 RepID=UPI0016437EC2|nr:MULTISPECIES: hypothetical protein [unclassified Stappia]